MAKSRELKVVISGDPSQLNRAFAKAGMGASQFESKVGKASTGIGRSLVTMGKVGSVALAGGLLVGLKESIGAFAEAEKVAAQTTATLKSTGGAANVTAKQIGDLATAISKKSGMDDEAVQSGENLLLTFTNIQNVTGKSNDIFNQTVGIMADLSTALGQDTKSSAIQLGKALNDPVKGVTALQRVGVSFTKDQKEQIKTLVASGKTLDAQKLILKELTKEFGGSAEAAGNTFSGKINKAKVAVGNLGEAIGGALAPAIGTAADKLSGFVEKLANTDRPAKFFGSIKDFAGDARDAVDDLFHTFDALKSTRGSAGAAIGQMFADAFAHIDWRGIGDKISTGISSALNFGDKMSAEIAEGISTAASNVDGRKALSGLLRVLSEALDALFAPSFWIENFKSIFAVVTFVIPLGKIFKIPGFGLLYNLISKPIFKAVGLVGEGLLSLFRRVGSRAFTSFLAELEKMAPRTANALLKVSTSGANALRSFPGRVGGWASRAVGTMADKLGDGIGRVVGIMARLVSRALSPITGAIKSFGSAGSRIGRSVVDGIVGAIRSAAGAIRGAISSIIPGPVKDALKKAGGAAKSIANSLGLATGGRVAGNPALGDVVPALLTGGEVVLNQKQQRMVGEEQIAHALSVTGGKMVGLASGGVIGPAAVSRMQSFAKSMASKNLPYTYGGGHSGFTPSPGFDCSGYVSAILHAGGALNSPMAVRQPLQGQLLPGPGKFVTVGIRGTSGKNAHTMIKVGNRYFESGGGGNGAHERAGWNGSFDLFHPANEASGDYTGNGQKDGAGSGGSATKKVKGTAIGLVGGGPHKSTDTTSAFDVASAGADVGVAQAGTTAGTRDDMNALGYQKSVITARVQKIKKALKKPLTPATRQRLLSELAGLIGTSSQIDTQISDLQKLDPKTGKEFPTTQDYLASHLSTAQLTSGLDDDMSALADIRNQAQSDYNAAVGGGDPRAIKDAADALKSASDNFDSIVDQMKQQQVDWANADLALAQLTDTLDDDKAALEKKKALDEQALEEAKAANDPRKIAEAASNLKADTDALKSLTASIDEQNKMTQELIDLNKQVVDNQNKIINLTTQQGPQILSAVIAAVSGGIGGKAGLGFQSVGYAGGVARY